MQVQSVEVTEVLEAEIPDPEPATAAGWLAALIAGSQISRYASNSEQKIGELCFADLAPVVFKQQRFSSPAGVVLIVASVLGAWCWCNRRRHGKSTASQGAALV